MRPVLRPFSIAYATWFLMVGAGCNESPPPRRSAGAPQPVASVERPPVASVERPPVLDATVPAERESQSVEPPAAATEFTVPPGWTESEPRSLPRQDDGFSVAYDHPTGLTVTFYQYTRGRATISDDLAAEPTREELDGAKRAIQDAVELGYWDSAEEMANDTVTLGESPQRALWSQYELTADGETLVSDIYVWVRANAFMKLRCTYAADDIDGHRAVLAPLLTALGVAAPAGE